MEFLNLNDCAIELTKFMADQGMISAGDRDEFVDLLVPEFNGSVLPYDEHVAKLRELVMPAPVKTSTRLQKNKNVYKRLVPGLLRPFMRRVLERTNHFIERALEA